MIGGEDDNSNSFESHSDFDLNHSNEKKSRASNQSSAKSSRQKNRRGMSVNWGSSSPAPAATNTSSTMTNTNRRYLSNRGQINHKHGSNVKFFATSMAQSLYRNPIRLSGLSATLKMKGTNSLNHKHPSQTPTNQAQMTIPLTQIPLEPELILNRINPPPQPRPESLAIMSEELFHQRLKARQTPPALNNPSTTTTSLLTVNKQLSTNFPSTSSFLLDTHCIEDVTYSTKNQSITTNPNQTITPEKTKSNLLESPKEEDHYQPSQDISSPIKAIINFSADSSDDSWRLLNSNSSLDEHIPYIDETDFEDLGKNKNPFYQMNFFNQIEYQQKNKITSNCFFLFSD
jgi:hypothetical protein